MRRALSDAEHYSYQKYALSLLDTLYLLVLLYAFVAGGVSTAIAAFLRTVIPVAFFVLPAYLLVISAAYYILSFPIVFYRTFTLEHRYGLSRMSVRQWIIDQIKSGLLSYIIALVLIGIFYFIFNRNPATWWIYTSVFWIVFTLLLAKLTPLVIIPLFFKYKPLEDDVLRERIFSLGEKMKVRFLNVFEIDMSKKTEKANAAFVGWGSTKRVLLGDTLKDKYTYDEVSVILAHEFAHYKYKHLLKLILINASFTTILFYLIFRTHQCVLGWFGLPSLSALSALPVIFIYMQIFNIIIQPLHGFISRHMERNADRAALAATGSPEAFISMMNKLARQNLADNNPHPLIKFFFFDHPTVTERIRMAESFARSPFENSVFKDAR